MLIKSWFSNAIILVTLLTRKTITHSKFHRIGSRAPRVAKHSVLWRRAYPSWQATPKKTNRRRNEDQTIKQQKTANDAKIQLHPIMEMFHSKMKCSVIHLDKYDTINQNQSKTLHETFQIWLLPTTQFMAGCIPWHGCCTFSFIMGINLVLQMIMAYYDECPKVHTVPISMCLDVCFCLYLGLTAASFSRKVSQLLAPDQAIVGSLGPGKIVKQRCCLTWFSGIYL